MIEPEVAWQPAPCFVCRCMEVEFDPVRRAINERAATPDDVKRRTRVVLGACKGVSCLPVVADWLAAPTGRPLSQIVPMIVRPPLRALSPAALAGAAEGDEQGRNASASGQGRSRARTRVRQLPRDAVCCPPGKAVAWPRPFPHA